MTPLACPRCGATLNRHAEKVVAPASNADLAYVDPVLGGVVEEMHSCPRCGASAVRRSPGDVVGRGA